MAAAEETVATPVPAAKPKKEKKPKVVKSPEERKEARSALLQLLLIVLVGVAIVYFGLNTLSLSLGLIFFVLGRVVGIGS